MKDFCVLINGDSSVDKRGRVTFINDFDMKDVKRFYIVENWTEAPRAWHGHKKESKYVYVPIGTAKIMVKNMETGERKDHILSEHAPQVLHIPPGNYNGSVSLERGTKIMYFSTSTLEESKADDFREDYK